MSDAADRSATDPGVYPSRRELLRRAVGLAAVSPTLALLREPAVAHARVAPSIQGAGSLSAGTFPTVETRYGKVQGVKAGTVFQFKGVPYGAPTGGSNRFMPPRPPKAWTGVKECYAYGGVSPQMPPDPRGEYRLLINFDQLVGYGGPMGEDMLSLNIWTPGVNDNARRAVLVSIHGGGYVAGSGGLSGYDGAQLAMFGDVVVVTVTHRLSSFGYLNLSDLGAPEEFKFASVAGLMDLVASLEWVRDNIANFGGDPGRVMIFGQSGGGAKTTALLGCPAAKGLFHRAAVQSGSLNRIPTREDGAKLAKKLLDLLQIAPGKAADLRNVPWQELLAATAKVGGDFSPVVDGTWLPHQPFDPAAPAESASVPMIVGTTLEDSGLWLSNFNLDEAGLKRILAARVGAQADAVYATYRGRYPKKSPYLIQAQIATDGLFRKYAIQQAERKAAQGSAPVWMYRWDWAPDCYDGKFGATHAVDVSASFRNVRDVLLNGGRADGQKVANELSSAWVAFAKTGDPNNSAVPTWPAYDTTKRATLIVDNETRVENDPNSEMRQLWEKVP